MTRRVPILASILVALAVAVMIWLGLWQLQRATWKQGLIDRYAKAEGMPPIAWPTVSPEPDALPLFRYATGNCLRIEGKSSRAGENRSGEIGYVQIRDCATGTASPGMSVEIGWSKNPNAQTPWSGGPVSGIIVPDRRSGMRLVAATAAPGLELSKVPSVDTISSVTPAGHKGYAATWFAFALIALIIYGLALRRRNRDDAAER
ncbi:MAG: SURF1 family cytochrome oxidase biogenesis protein [Sphingomicrobium sp.]